MKKINKKVGVVVVIVAIAGIIFYKYSSSSADKASCYVLHETIKPVEVSIEKNIEDRVQELEGKEKLDEQVYETFKSRYNEYSDVIKVDTKYESKLNRKYKKDYEKLKELVAEYKDNGEKYIETKEEEYRQDAIENYNSIKELYDNYKCDKNNSEFVEPVYK